MKICSENTASSSLRNFGSYVLKIGKNSGNPHLWMLRCHCWGTDRCVALAGALRGKGELVRKRGRHHTPWLMQEVAYRNRRALVAADKSWVSYCSNMLEEDCKREKKNNLHTYRSVLKKSIKNIFQSIKNVNSKLIML